MTDCGTRVSSFCFVSVTKKAIASGRFIVLALTCAGERKVGWV
jgi:hypothetical protein